MSWRRYRDGFALLQHLHELTAGWPGAGAPWPRVAMELGMTDSEAEWLLDLLVAGGYIEYHAGAREVALTPAGTEYMTWRRGRRYSVRPYGTPPAGGSAAPQGGAPAGPAR